MNSSVRNTFPALGYRYDPGGRGKLTVDVWGPDLPPQISLRKSQFTLFAMDPPLVIIPRLLLIPVVDLYLGHYLLKVSETVLNARCSYVGSHYTWATENVLTNLRAYPATTVRAACTEYSLFLEITTRK